MEDLKLDPYKRLKSILTDGDPLSEKGSDNLDELLGIKKEERKKTFIDKIISFFKKIDSSIFKKPGKITNMPHKRMR